jgi:hypothetical protein
LLSYFSSPSFLSRQLGCGLKVEAETKVKEEIEVAAIKASNNLRNRRAILTLPLHVYPL